MKNNLNSKINHRIDKLLSYPGCDAKTLNMRKTLWLASIAGLLFVFPFVDLFYVTRQQNAINLYYNGYMAIDLSITIIITPFLKKLFIPISMVTATLRVTITFFFIAKLGGIPIEFAMLFVALAYVFLTIPLRIIWFTTSLFGLYSVLTIVVAILGPSIKAPDDQLLDFGIKMFFMVIVIIFMSALALYFVISFLKKQEELEIREVQKQKELNEAKTRLFTNVTHEFRTPLTIISGMANLIEKKPEQWIPEGTNRIRTNSNLMLRLVNQLLDISKIEAKAMPVHMVQGDIAKYIGFIVELHRSAALVKNISINLKSGKETFNMDFDPDIISQILSNLLSNAIKFTPETGNIEIKTVAGDNEETFEIQVTDTGKGIPEDKLPFVFDRFYQVENHANSGGGTGLGLALAKELTKLLNGDITVESHPGKGSVFTFTLPVTRKAEPGEEILNSYIKSREIQKSNNKAVTPAPVSGLKTNLPHLLIVEDSMDVSLYISAILSEEYRVELANNGKTGLEKALENIPDIIISDVMMPEMDGIEMLDKLKNDFRISHIPVVLLTAKADIDSRLAGLERGADAYITKPFNETELYIQLRNLIELRKKLHERYSSMLDFSESREPALKTEDAFVSKVRELLEKNIGNDEFNINEICHELAVSHTQLYRKFKSISNLTIADYFKLIRLNKAKQLLADPDLNITQVAFAVGFKNLSHFSREFTMQFGKSPKEIKKEKLVKTVSFHL